MANTLQQNNSANRHIVQYDADYSLCAGCSACEILCGLLHDAMVGPKARRIFVEKDSTQLLHKVHACQHCTDHPCFDACPPKVGAMRLDAETGVVCVDEEKCIGCKLCIKACPFTPKRIQIGPKGKAIKCDLCRTRPEGPACIEYCQVMCLGLSDWESSAPNRKDSYGN
ncbi:MAG: 4Fe-4S dicluster domain-containing protein [Clostridiales Family XIII bacterium]|jgi:Fe-S-cluster-containing hydrogenase component 2|nr:4Fe-4S dicluster domain-containing protein [Clostridiales Family XIII bacterium]